MYAIVTLSNEVCDHCLVEVVDYELNWSSNVVSMCKTRYLLIFILIIPAYLKYKYIIHKHIEK